MAARGEWTEADQRRVDAQYAALWADLKRVVAAGQDPADPEAQDLARRQIDLIEQFTQHDPDVEAGLKQWWQNYHALPEDQRPKLSATTDEEQIFLSQAMTIYRQQNGSDGF